MQPILFSIGPVNFYSYGLMVSVAFFASMGIFYYFANPKKLWHKNTFTYFIITLFLVAMFARLAFFLAYYDKYFDHWWEVFYLWNGGLVSYGGIVGMIVSFVIFFRPRLLENLDILAISVLGGGIFWRIGGILAGSYPTLQYDNFLSVHGRFPAVEIESFFLLVGFIIFSLIYKKSYFKSGNIFFLVIAYYGIIRLFIDYYRIYPTVIFSLNIGQFTGLIFLLIAILSIFLLKNGRNNKKYNK
jgi:phosphatidylglycerol:prolipoprotein diacylglycerol transferase